MSRPKSQQTFSLLAIITIIAAALTITAPPAPAEEPPIAVFVSSSSTAVPNGDTVAISRLSDAGFTVTVIDDNDADPTDADGADVVLISSSISPSTLGSTFVAVAAPTIIWEPYIFDDMGLTATGSGNRGQVGSQKTIDIVDPSHVLAAGLSGSPVVADTKSTFSWGQPTNDAQVVSTLAGRPEKPSIFVYDQGDALATGPAPGMRIGLYLGNDSPRYWNENGIAIFDAAIALATSAVPPPPPPPPPSGDLDALFVAADTTITAQEQPAVDRLVGLGFSVTVAADNNATAADAAGMDLVVIASSIAAYRLDDSFTDIAIPLVAWEARAFDDLGFTASNNEQGEISRSNIDIESSTHPITDGLSPGSTTVYDSSGKISWGRPLGSATIIATVNGSTDKVTTFAYDTGEPMANDTAAARRVGLFLGQNAPPILTSDGWTLFDNTIIWAVGAASPPPSNAAPVADAGVNIAASTGVEFSLAGMVTDDGLVEITPTSTWIVPTGVTVTDVNALDSTATISPAGTYTLNLKVDDGEFVVFDSVVITVADVTPPPPPPDETEVLFIASSIIVSSDEQPAVDRLVELGFTVTPADEDTATAADAVGMDLVVIASSIVPNQLDDSFTDIAVPLVAWEPRAFDDLGFTIDNGEQGETSRANIVLESITHPIIGGLPPGTTNVYAGKHKVSWGRPEGTPTIIATVNGSSDKVTTFAYDTGEPMANGTAAARRVGFFLGPNGPDVLTADGWTLFDNAMIWAVSKGVSPPVVLGQRVATDLVALYEFESGNGSVVVDSSGVGSPLNLTINDPGTTTWLDDGGIQLDTASLIRSAGPATKIIDAITATNSLTIEMWIDPQTVDASDPSRLITISADDVERNVSLNQGMVWSTKDRVEARIRTTQSGAAGLPSAETPVGSLSAQLVHLVLTRNTNGNERLYLDGQLVNVAVVDGDLSIWNPTLPLALAAEADGTRPWLGDLHLVAIYNRALLHSEVCQNASAGPGHTTAGYSAPFACFDTSTAGGSPPYTFAASAAASSDIDGTIESVVWDFGDGSTSIDLNVQHVYATKGDYTVTLTLTDDAGFITSDSRVIVVRGDPQLPAAPPALADALGFRAGGGFFTTETWLFAENWLGREINYTTQFLERSSPTGMSASALGLMTSTTSGLTDFSDRIQLSLTVPLGFGSATAHTSNGRAQILANLEAVANGDHDTEYLLVAQRLADGNYGDAILRLGHEFDGKWPPWSSRENEAAFIAAWRHVHDLFMGVSTDFRFDWNSTRDAFTEFGPAAYPGDGYVDIIGMDIYWRPQANDPTWDFSKWANHYLDKLVQIQAFATTHGKPLSIPEWGLIGVDEPRFIEEMFRFFAGLPETGPGSLEYHAYFDAGQSRDRMNDFPSSRVAFQELFRPTG